LLPRLVTLKATDDCRYARWYVCAAMPVANG